MRWLVAYDVTDDRRRLEIARLLEDHGQRVQFSVFECDLDERAQLRLRRKLVALLDQSADSVRIYGLCRRCRGAVEVLGTGPIREEQRVQVI